VNPGFIICHYGYNENNMVSLQRERPEEGREEGKRDLPVDYNNKFPSCSFPAMIRIPHCKKMPFKKA